MYPRKTKQIQPSNTVKDNKNSVPKYYSDKEQDSKKKLIVLKVLEDLKKRHKKLIERLNLTDKYLKQGLNGLIKKEGLVGFDYSKFLSKAEQEFIVDSVIKSNSANKNSNTTNNNINLHYNSQNNTNSENYLLHNNNSVHYKNNYEYDTDKTIRSRNDRTNNEKSGANASSPKNSNVNGINYNHSNAKFDELKLVKEKDEWGILAKKNYMEYLDDKISKLQRKEEKKKEITDILAKQILEKNQQKQIRMSNEERFFESLTKDVENWKQTEAIEKQLNDHKLKEFIEKRDNFFKSKLDQKLQEERAKKEMEKEYLNKIEQEKLQELHNKMHKKMQNKQIYSEQMEQAKANENSKKHRKQMENEEGKVYVEKYEGLLDNKDRERQDIKLGIQEKAKLRDLRESLSINVKSMQEMIDNEIENKYRKEKEELDRKDKGIELDYSNKRKTYIESMIQSHDEQQMQRRNQKLNEKIMDRKHYEENLIPQLHAYRQEQFNNEKTRIDIIKKYKEELDKQVNENKKIKYGTGYLN